MNESEKLTAKSDAMLNIAYGWHDMGCKEILRLVGEVALRDIRIKELEAALAAASKPIVGKARAR